MRATCSSTTEPIVHVGSQPASSCTNVRSTAMPCGVWTTSGWNCTPQMRRLVVLEHGDRRVGVDAVAMKPAGDLGDGVEVAHPHVLLVGDSAPEQRRLARVRVRWARPYSPRMPRPTVPPSCWAISWAP